MDKIVIKGLKLFAYHGVNPEEKRDGQNFVIDITANIPLLKAGQSDELVDTVSYAKILKTARAAFCENKYDLIETAAQHVAAAVLKEYKEPSEVTVCVKKPEAPIKADFDYVAVEITRGRHSA